jgi:hypothetical protein
MGSDANWQSFLVHQSPEDVTEHGPSAMSSVTASRERSDVPRLPPVRWFLASDFRLSWQKRQIVDPVFAPFLNRSIGGGLACLGRTPSHHPPARGTCPITPTPRRVSSSERKPFRERSCRRLTRAGDVPIWSAMTCHRFRSQTNFSAKWAVF